MTIQPFDRKIAAQVVSILLSTAEAESKKSCLPPSQITTLEGSPQPETPHERLERILIAAVFYGLEQGVLLLPLEVEALLTRLLRIDRGF